MIFVFDICDTLFLSNTTFDFITYVVQTKKRNPLTLDLIISKRSPFRYLLGILNKMFHKDLHKTFAAQILKGLSEEELNALAESFYHNVLSKKRNEPVWKMFIKLKTAHHLLLLSSTLDPIARAIAHNNAVDYRATTLKYENGRFTGSIENDLTGKKHEVASHFTNKPYGVVTDNLSDRELVAGATQRFVVIKKESEKKAWQDLSVTFISGNNE